MRKKENISQDMFDRKIIAVQNFSCTSLSGSISDCKTTEKRWELLL